MPVPYSLDLRQKVIGAYEQGHGSQRALAELFGVSQSWLEQLWSRYRTTGEVAPKPHGGGRRARIEAPAQALLREYVHEQPDATLEELCGRLAGATGVRVSPATLCRTLQRMRLPRKKSRCMPQNAIPSVSNRRVRTITG